MHSDFKDLLSALNAFRVEYLVIGGFAYSFHAEPRYTKDLDVWIRADSDNASRVFKALKLFGAPLLEMSADDFAHEGFFYQIGVPPIRVDVLMSVSGVSFADAWNRRVAADMDGIPTNILSRDDLIASKLAAGRPQDLVDVKVLRHKLKSTASRRTVKREQKHKKP
jgi:hypothetical protein